MSKTTLNDFKALIFCSELSEQCAVFQSWKTHGTFSIEKETGRFIGKLVDRYGEATIYGIIRDGIVYFIKEYNGNFHYVLSSRKIKKICMDNLEGFYQGNWNPLSNKKFSGTPLAGHAGLVLQKDKACGNSLVLQYFTEIDWDKIEKDFEKFSPEIDKSWYSE